MQEETRDISPDRDSAPDTASAPNDSPDTLREQLLAQLETIVPAGINKSIVELGFVKSLEISPEGDVHLHLALRAPHTKNRDRIQSDAEAACREVEGIRAIAVHMEDAKPAQATQSASAFSPELIQQVKSVIAVASGKGGVGKSTVTANLAAALSLEGFRVGILDADLYGPSMNLMFGITADPEVGEDKSLFPVTVAGGIKVVSMAMFSDPNEATIWRGPMASQMIQNFLFRVHWGELDYLLIDLPPGTGDIQLTLTQNCPMTGALIVTTPQEVSVIDARKGLRMFAKVSVPVLGVIENMSTFLCDGCGKEHHIFSQGGGERMAASQGVPFMGTVPIEPLVGKAGDTGHPAVLSHPNSTSAKRFIELARTLHAQVTLLHDTTLGMATYNTEGALLPVVALDAPHPAKGGKSAQKPADFGSSAQEPATGTTYPVPVRIGQTRTSRDTDSAQKSDSAPKVPALLIDWSDGMRTVAPFRDLRLRCPCASCIDEWTGQPLLDPRSVPDDVRPNLLNSIGRYAVRIVWSDGHASGIYSYDYLRRIR
jgi:ATP-binding protein involved in chromosome partitioning